LLRRDRLLTDTPASHLLALAAAGRSVPLAAGTLLAGPDRSPALVLVLEGEVEIESERGPVVTAGAGTSIGLLATLAGRAPANVVRVTGPGTALQWARDDLFAVLADRIDLLQVVLRHALALRRSSAPDSPAGPDAISPTMGASLI
jgi:CRP-like cAMP-binding protein